LGLAASTGTGAGTILEFDLTGNILPSAGTYNSVSKIDSALSMLKSYIFFTYSGVFNYTIPSGINLINIEAAGGGAAGNGAINSGATNSGGTELWGRRWRRRIEAVWKYNYPCFSWRSI